MYLAMQDKPRITSAWKRSILSKPRIAEFIVHSYNDYEQDYPLKTALENNFNSIEIDMVEFGGEIIVSHDEKN